MSDDPGTVALVIAAVNDESTKARLGQLQAALAEVKAEREAALAAQGKNHEILVGIQEARREVEARSAEIIDRERKLKDDTDRLTGVIASHTAERDRWEAVRKTVDADHVRREAALKEAEAAAERQGQAIAAAQEHLDRREHAVAEREAATHRRHQAIEAALKVA